MCLWWSFVCDLVQFPFFIPQVPLTHPDYPLNGEFGKISSLEQSQQNPGQNGDGAPGISCHDLFGETKPVLPLFLEDEIRRKRTHHIILLNVRVPPLENSKIKLVDLVWRMTAVIKFHHSCLENPAETTELNQIQTTVM